MKKTQRAIELAGVLLESYLNQSSFDDILDENIKHLRERDAQALAQASNKFIERLIST